MNTTWMRSAVAIGVAVALTGCDFLVPISHEPAGRLDESLVGLWRRTDPSGPTEDLLVLKWDEGHWLVSLPAGRQDALYARGWPVRVADRTLVQLEWIGSGKGAVVQDARRYQLATWSRDGDRLIIRRINPEVVGRDWCESQRLREAIEKTLNQPDVFIDERVFHRVPQEP
jgi:hypothetical protein